MIVAPNSAILFTSIELTIAKSVLHHWRTFSNGIVDPVFQNKVEQFASVAMASARHVMNCQPKLMSKQPRPLKSGATENIVAKLKLLSCFIDKEIRTYFRKAYG